MVNFGTATLVAPVSKSRARKHDCGRYGQLTVRQIAALSKLSKEGVTQRIRAGVVGAALCAPRHDGLRRTKEPCKRPVMLLAMKLARAFPDKVPSPRAIQQVHPMCKRQAQRWRQALVDCAEVANGQ